MQFKPFVLAILGVALGVGGCLQTPPPLGPAPVGPYIGCVTPIIVDIPCGLGNWGCPTSVVIHNSAQLLSTLTSCGISCPVPSNPCNFNTQMLIGVSLVSGCTVSTSLESICYFSDHVQVTILSTLPPKGGAICNYIALPWVEWVAVPASNLPVIFN
jgi:hypothetical protein